MLIAAVATVAAALISTSSPATPAPDSTCHVIELVADDYVQLGSRFDGPEFIRGLHQRGDSAGSPIRLAARGVPTREVFLWATDTFLDGAEKYDRIEMTLSVDAAGLPEQMIPLRAGVWERVPVRPEGAALAELWLPDVSRGLRNLRLCWR